MRIENLVHYPQHINDVSEMIYDEFVVKANGKMTFDEVVRFFSNTKTHEFPITYIALENDVCIGTVSIFENDLKTQDRYKPWLASLYVKPAYRSKGIGQALIRKALQVTKELGYQRLFLRTEHASDYYRKLGWQFVSKAMDPKGLQTNIFKMVIG
jgi:predicted N-acetyltransferase YhbS